MRTLKATLVISILLAVFALPAVVMAAGETGAIFLDIFPGARPEGLGGAYTAIADDANSVAINPAGMTHVKGQEVTLMHNEYMFDMDQEYIAYVSSDGRRAWGGSLVYFDFGAVQGYTASNTFTGAFHPKSYALTVAYSQRPSETWSWGVSLKYIREKIADAKGDAFALDGGVLYTPPESGWRFGLALLNLGTKIDVGENADPLPLTLRVGAAYHLTQYPVLLVSDVLLIRNNSPEFHFGLEYSFVEIAALRVGYNADHDLDSGLTFGVGFSQPEYKIDYAYVPMGVFGDAHRFSLSLMF